jgi:hypothetical protein
MKRGWITWDKSEIPPSVFDARLAVVRQQLAARDLPALVVYTDVWRSNQGRYLANFMPYWNRALLVIPRDGAPILLCGLSPRVYPWIRSVTILDEIRPSQNIAQQLTNLCAEKGWTKIGVLDLPMLPSDLAIPNSVDVPWNAIHPEPDEVELSMYRRAAKLAREILEAELPNAANLTDHEFVARLELRYRRAGIEDLVILTTNGATPPLPPAGSTLAPACAVSVAMEYRGHWVKIVRSAAASTEAPIKTELLSGPYPYEYCPQDQLAPRAIFAMMSRSYGDTYRQGPNGPELL